MSAGTMPVSDELRARRLDQAPPTSWSGTSSAGCYRLIRQIGSGSSSIVFEAEHSRLGKRFAVKLLRPDVDPSRRMAQRFRREAQAIAQLASDHVVDVVDCGELDDGTPYLVMALLAGEDLRSLLAREGALPALRAVPLAVDLCLGLKVVHAAGLVHRDLKPENVFVTRRDTGEDVGKILDFGVAKMDASVSTAEGALIGTVRYMAPEQLIDSASVSPATDIYALGAILYECLAGTPLVAGRTVQEVMYRIMNFDPAPLRQRLPTVPTALCDVIERCLSRDSAARPSAEELARHLLAAVHARVEAQDPTHNEDPPPSRRRSGQPSWRTVNLLGAALIGALAAAVLGWWPSASSPAREPSSPAARAREPAAPTSESAAPVALPSPLVVAEEKPPPVTPGARRSAPVSPSVKPASAQARFDSTNPYDF